MHVEAIASVQRKDHMEQSEIVVEGYVATGRIDLRQEVWGMALDQRAFGPRRLVVAFAHASGLVLSVAHTTRTDLPELALEACIMHLGKGAAAAVAFCDEPVAGPPPPGLDRALRARPDDRSEIRRAFHRLDQLRRRSVPE